MKNDGITRALHELDLSENEAILYSRMLTRPPSTAQELGTYTPFPRTMLYYVLKLLMQRGLVSAKKEHWRTVYIAEDPDRLYDLLAKKVREFDRETHTIQELIPKLKNQYRLAGKRTGVRMFEGVGEYQKALDDVIYSQPDEVYAYEVLREKKPGFEIRKTYERRRAARKMGTKVLFFESAEALRFLATREYDDYTEFRSIRPGVITPFSTDVTLYSGKLLYSSYYDQYEPTAVLVDDAALYEMQKNVFEMLWKQGKDRTLAHIQKV